jgi:hypothetical protein
LDWGGGGGGEKKITTKKCQNLKKLNIKTKIGTNPQQLKSHTKKI